MRRVNQPMLTAAESLIGITYDDPMRAAKRDARQIVRDYDFAWDMERREVAEDGHAGKTYRLVLKLSGRTRNDYAEVSVSADGRGAFWGYETIKKGLWSTAYDPDSYWLATKAWVEAWWAGKAAASPKAARVEAIR